MKASKRRARTRNQSKAQNKIMPAAFSELEEAFFREGAELSAASSGQAEAFAELEESRPRPSLWRRLFA